MPPMKNPKLRDFGLDTKISVCVEYKQGQKFLCSSRLISNENL